MARMLRSSDGLAACLDNFPNMSVSVRFNANQTYVVDVNLKNTVMDIKEKLAIKTNTTVNNINLVIAGQLMENHRQIEDYGLGSHTTLHAFCWSDDGLSQPLTPSSANLATASFDSDASRKDLGDVNENSIQAYQRFFVYCKLCGSVKPGHLRVHCRSCGSGAFLVDRGPSSWEDISTNTQIEGECKTCQHNRPRFYMRCSESHQGDVDGTAVVLKHVQTNRRRVECIICADVISHILIFPCPAGHVICIECFRQYGSTCLSERRFIEHPIHGYTLPCPAGCADVYIEENHHFLIMGKEKYERYKNFGAEEFVLQNGGVLCPFPGCGSGIFPKGRDRRVPCPECQFVSCRDCQREHHDGDCEEHLQSQVFNVSGLAVTREQAERASWEQQSLSLIEETTKACPDCRVKTTRTGGCMHMVCPRCEHEWCWMCVKSWTRDCQADHWFG